MFKHSRMLKPLISNFFKIFWYFRIENVQEHSQQIWDNFVYFCQKAPTFSMPRQNFAIFQNWKKTANSPDE